MTLSRNGQEEDAGSSDELPEGGPRPEPMDPGNSVSEAQVEPPTPLSPSEIRVQEGRENLLGGQPGQAIERFAAALSIDPMNADAMLGTGAAYLALAKYDQAEKEFRKILRLWPNRVDAHHQLGVTLFRRGVYGGAVQQLRRATEIDPEFGPSYLVLGESLNQIGESDAAIEALETAVRLLPENGKAFYALGIAYDRKALPDRAAEMYRRSREVGFR